MKAPTDILLVTLNARYSHASLGLRYLQANLGELQSRSAILELVIAASSGMQIETMLEKILQFESKIVGFGVYIWNVEETTRLVAQLRRVAPDIKIILGGPEVSFEKDLPTLAADAHYIIAGQGENVFKSLCEKLLASEVVGLPLNKFISGDNPELDTLALPYSLYSEQDLAHRHIYIEASRGCPFKCEFCLSALDKTAWAFPLEKVLQELETLYARGLRRFKFVDRTFNLKIDVSRAILNFFLEKISLSQTSPQPSSRHPHNPLFVHFELVPDHLPDALKETIANFPEGVLQFEIGIQTWNPVIQQRISRRQNNDKASANIQWLVEHAKAHLHVDLIIGLPGEDIASFGVGFDRLVKLRPHEIQVGILKRLRGAPIDRHTTEFSMVYSPSAPYNILKTSVISFAQMQRMQRFARYWDMYANSGRFQQQITKLLFAEKEHAPVSPFSRMMALSDWLYANTDATHRLSLDRQQALLSQFLAGSEAPSSSIQAAATKKLKTRQDLHRS